MCGRYATTRTPAELDDAFGARLGDAFTPVEPDYNMAPTKQAPLVIGRAADATEPRELLTATWGLVPSWAKDRSIGNRMINARSETVADKPAFKRAFAKRRAIVPADGYYEWYAGQEADDEPAGPKKRPKQPFFITAPDRRVLGLAGLYEFWRPDAEQEWLITFTILTTSAEDDAGRLHDRAPLLVVPEARDAWLEPAPHRPDELLEMLVPATPGRLEAWPVSTAVNNVRNNGPELIEPLPAE